MKLDKNNPWLVGIAAGIISAVVSGLLVGTIFLKREQKFVQRIHRTRVNFANKLLKAELPEEALRIYDDVLHKLPEKDKHLYAHIHNQTARCYLCLARRGDEITRNLIRAAVAFEEGLRAFGSQRSRESIFAEIELSLTYWSLSWFQEAEANIAKSVKLLEDVQKLYPELQLDIPFVRMGIIPSDDMFRRSEKSPTTEEDLNQHIRFAKATLKVCTIEKYPIAYALVQSNLGFFYLDLADFEDKTANLNESIRAFSESLKIFASDKYPRNYIDLNSSIALAYLKLSDVNDKGKNVQHTIEILGEVLTIANLESYPDKYAHTQEFLGLAYKKLSSVQDEEENLTKAISCCKNALEVCKQDENKFDYGSVQGQLGDIYLRFSTITDKDKNIKNSIDCFEKAINALKVYKPADSIWEGASVHERLGYLYLSLSTIKDKVINMKSAVDSFEKALNALNSEKQPREYERVKSMLSHMKESENPQSEHERK